MCLPSKERAAARQRAAATAAGVQLVEKLPTPNRDIRVPVGTTEAIRAAVGDAVKMKALCEQWAGNPVIDRYDWKSETPDYNALFLACKYGREDTARLLISAGADVNAVCHGFPALIHACIYGHLPIIRLLIHEGADVNAPLMIMTTPLDMIMDKIQAHRKCEHMADSSVPDDLLAVAELIKRAGGRRGGISFCCMDSCLRF